MQFIDDPRFEPEVERRISGWEGVLSTAWQKFGLLNLALWQTAVALKHESEFPTPAESAADKLSVTVGLMRILEFGPRPAQSIDSWHSAVRNLRASNPEVARWVTPVISLVPFPRWQDHSHYDRVGLANYLRETHETVGHQRQAEAQAEKDPEVKHENRLP